MPRRFGARFAYEERENDDDRVTTSGGGVPRLWERGEFLCVRGDSRRGERRRPRGDKPLRVL